MSAFEALHAQAPRIARVELYGLRRVSAERVRKALGVNIGDTLPPSKDAVEERIEKLPNIVAARLEAVCCEEGGAVLFVGIEEKGAPHFAFRSPPAGEAVLPEELLDLHRRLLEAIERAARHGSTAEDLTHGHPLMADPDARDLQQQMAKFAAANLDLLRKVLRESADGEHRAIATTVIGYAPSKKDVVADLQLAMQDPDQAVRASAMRALGAIGVLAVKQPDLEIKIAPTWFIEMLNSLVLSDKQKAAAALVNLTEDRNPTTLEPLRSRALNALVEMAQWQTLQFALPAYILLGRVGGLSEREIQESWSSGERAKTIMKILKKK